MTIDTTYLDSGADKVKPARPALLAIAQEINLLEGSGGSALVGYLPVGAGAVATDVQSKLREVEGIKGYGVKAVTPINIRREAQPGLARLRYDLTRIGVSPQNVVQSFTVDEVNGYIYTHHISTTALPPDESSVINRYSLHGDVAQTATVSSSPSLAVGHQGLAVEYLSSGAVKLWGSAPYGTGNGTKAVCFDFVVGAGGAGGAEIANVETYQLFPTDTSSQSSSPCVSYDGRFLIAEKNATVGGVVGNLIRVFSLPELRSGGAGDYSTLHLVEFFVSVTNGAASTPAMQSMACDGAFIYFLSGNSSVSDTHTLAAYTLTGDFVMENRDFSVGKSDAATVGAGSFYEPEGLAICTYNGRPMLFAQIAVGDSGARGCYVYGLGMRSSVRSQPGDVGPGFMSVSANIDYAVPTGEEMVFGTWDSVNGFETTHKRDVAGRFIYNHTAALSISPTGSAGTQILGDSIQSSAVQARFAASAEGVRKVFYKSRSATIGGASGAGTKLLLNDRIATLSFVGDDGSANYSSSAGVVGAEIRATLEADSTTGVMPARMELWTNGVRRWQVTSGGNLNPATGNSFNIGNASQQVKDIFSVNAVTVTSDSRNKQQIAELTEKEKRIAARLKGLVRTFKFNDSVEQKGSAARIHVGVMAQEVKAEFEAEGLNPFAYAMLCFDSWDEIQESKDEDGNVNQEYVASGNRYGIRYEELLAFIVSAL